MFARRFRAALRTTYRIRVLRFAIAGECFANDFPLFANALGAFGGFWSPDVTIGVVATVARQAIFNRRYANVNIAKKLLDHA